MHDASFMHEIKMMDDVQRLWRQTQRPFKFVRACRRHAGLEPTYLWVLQNNEIGSWTCFHFIESLNRTQMYRMMEKSQLISTLSWPAQDNYNFVYLTEVWVNCCFRFPLSSEKVFNGTCSWRSWKCGEKCSIHAYFREWNLNLFPMRRIDKRN